MTVTVSIEEYIGQRFDRFYTDCEFKDVVEIFRKLKYMLEDLEADVIELAQQEFTSEAEDIREAAWDDGYKAGYHDGYEKGYDDGYEKGYDEGHDEGYAEGYAEGTLENE